MTLYAIDNQRYSYATGGNQPAHQCHCIGCCPDCGTCRTWSGHTEEYCRLLQRQADDREYLEMLQRAAP